MSKGKEKKIKMIKTKAQKGITLIALIITIVVLLILAVVAIASITNDGVLSYAENAATQYNQAVKNEQDTLQGYVDYLNKHNGGSNGGAGSDGEDDEEGTGSGTVLSIANQIQTSNTKVVDEFGNQIVVPAGFKIRVDEDAGTKGDEKSTATNVTEGIVIEDEAGNQFVWVPVGDIKTASGIKTITLGRYAEYNNGVNNYIPDENGVYTPPQKAEDYATAIIIEDDFTEDTTSNHTKDNSIARNIKDFIDSSNQNKGYYIGRFEAGNDSGTLVCRAGQTVYANIIQSDASMACKNMYNEGADGYNANTFSSDLINSYAWDTAIIFIQTFGGESNYYEKNYCSEITTTGGNQDEYCNINDMSGNVTEWTTESSDYWSYHCVSRGGYCGYEGEWYVIMNTSSRHHQYPTDTYSSISFRPLLYVAL